MRYFLALSVVFVSLSASVAQSTPELTVKMIMRDPKTWIGTSPTNPYWSEDSKTIYFNWNPDVNPGDSLYKVTPTGTPQKVTAKEKALLPSGAGVYSEDRSRKIFIRYGDLFLMETKTGKVTQLTSTVMNESNPGFSRDMSSVWFTAENNLYLLNLKTSSVTQLTDFIPGSDKDKKEKKKSEQEEWIKADELRLMQVLRERKDNAAQAKKMNDIGKPHRPVSLYLDGKNVSEIQRSPDEKYISFVLRKNPDDPKSTQVPNYVTESGYTENLQARPKVGGPQVDQQVGIYLVEKDTIIFVHCDGLPGVDETPAYKKDYTTTDAKPGDKKKSRELFAQSPFWSRDGKYAVIVVRSRDYKDRWITLLNPETATVKSLDRQHDDAWVGGPGIGGIFSMGNGELDWMADNKRIWFQSEETGYSHIYVLDVTTGQKKAITSGKFEVYNPKLSRDKKYWYFEANVDHPGDRQFYAVPADGGKMTKLTSRVGGHQAYLSPDETKIALLHSNINTPWELFVMDNPITTGKSSTRQLTSSLRPEFKSYPWRAPEVISFPARDGATVYARLYKPENQQKGGRAVIFVHGAGYLQNAHKWWSGYFREYMFHNLLADKGYTVLDIDYRGSAGYGRDWRTGIYRHMGGKDLTDHFDGAKYLIDTQGADPKKLGIYGGSYGGFIVLMSLFTEPDLFAAGAALRSVTDWSHYNHPYTANILNTPVEDSIAYRKSSPIYYAEGLKGSLLMCHGMVDTNVHFQEVVRLSQRLIELGKENWELAVYPMEDHGFIEPSSWTDEYSRILKLFEEKLK